MIATMPPALPGEHRNAALIRTLYVAIQNADPKAIIACYHDDAYFEDIAFQRDRKPRIFEMWQLVCHSRPRVTIDFDAIAADDQKGTGRWMATYMFGKTEKKPGRRVDNTLTSAFVFRDDLIATHHDRCHAMAWAVQAIPFPVSLLVGSITPLRRYLAKRRLKKFIAGKSAAGTGGVATTRGE
jgi:ketosteroid isomerase-like protein